MSEAADDELIVDQAMVIGSLLLLWRRRPLIAWLVLYAAAHRRIRRLSRG